MRVVGFSCRRCGQLPIIFGAGRWADAADQARLALNLAPGDLLFHVNEHRFTLLPIAEMLDSTALDFFGVEFGRESDRTRFLSRQGSPMAVRDMAACTTSRSRISKCSETRI